MTASLRVLFLVGALLLALVGCASPPGTESELVSGIFASALAGSDDVELTYELDGTPQGPAGFGEDLRALALRRLGAGRVSADVTQDDRRVRIVVDEAYAARVDELVTWTGTLLLLEPAPDVILAPRDSSSPLALRRDGADHWYEGSRADVLRAIETWPVDRDHRILAEPIGPSAQDREAPRWRTRVVKAEPAGELGDGALVGWGDGPSLRIRGTNGSPSESAVQNAKDRAREADCRARTHLARVPDLRGSRRAPPLVRRRRRGLRARPARAAAPDDTAPPSPQARRRGGPPAEPQPRDRVPRRAGAAVARMARVRAPLRSRAPRADVAHRRDVPPRRGRGRAGGARRGGLRSRVAVARPEPRHLRRTDVRAPARVPRLHGRRRSLGGGLEAPRRAARRTAARVRRARRRHRLRHRRVPRLRRRGEHPLLRHRSPHGAARDRPLLHERAGAHVLRRAVGIRARREARRRQDADMGLAASRRRHVTASSTRSSRRREQGCSR